MHARWIALTLTVTFLAAVPARADELKPETVVMEALKGVRLGEPLHAEPLILIPLIAPKAPKDLPLNADLSSKSLVIGEPEWPRRRFNVVVANEGKEAVLLLGGNFLVGGKLDRLIPRDLILRAGSRVEIETLPAEYQRDSSVEESPFRVGVKYGGATAPAYVRERARFDPSPRLVPIFTSHFLEFRDEKDTRKSLAAIDGSRLLASYCVVCQGKTRGFTEMEDGRVVGFISAVRGRLYLLELFGSNQLLRKYFPSILKAHAYNAAAIQLRSKKLNFPLPGEGDPKVVVESAMKQARALLAELQGKLRAREDDLPRNVEGASVLLRSKSSRGAALTLGTRLVHTVLFPDNPFERALYSRPIEVPAAEVTDSDGDFGSLSRRDERGTLSESEQRLLERMRDRRGR